MVVQLFVREDLNSLVQRERNKACPRGSHRKLKKFRRYARGNQPGVLSTTQIRILQHQLGNQFSDNICKRILEVASDRIEFTRWNASTDAVNEFLSDLYTKNQMATLATDVVWATLRDGNHGISLRWLDDDSEDVGGRVALYRERWWDGEEGLWFSYDKAGRELYAVKEWEEVIGGALRRRRNIYFPHEIRRFIQDTSGWLPFTLEDDDETVTPGVIAWTKDGPDGTDPLGIPIIHFRHGSDDDQPYGASDLDGGVLAFQDQINAIQHDISAASTLTGFQMTYSTGGPLEKDRAGNTRYPKVGPGEHWHSDKEQARFGVIPAGSVDSLEKSYWLKVGAVARMTSTPVHFFAGDWPSGEALIRSEIDLVNKCIRLIKYAGPSFSSVGHRATEMFNVFSSGGSTLDENDLIVAMFGDPARRDIQTLSTVANLQADFTSKAERLRMTGRSEEQVIKILAEIEEEETQSLERMQRQFNEGNESTTGIPLGEETDDAE